MIASLSVRWASFGRSSEIWIPGTFVSIGWNGSANGVGRLGFHVPEVEMAEGAQLKIRITDFGARTGARWQALERRKPGSEQLRPDRSQKLAFSQSTSFALRSEPQRIDKYGCVLDSIGDCFARATLLV